MKFWARRYDYRDLNCDFYDLSNIAPSVDSDRSLITSNVIYSDRVPDLSDEEIVEETLLELSEYFPEVQDAEVRHSVVNRIPLAIHCPYPGTHQRRPHPDAPIEGMYLAGDWIDTGLPSSMESAAKSGWMVAESILDADGRDASIAEPEREIEGVAKMIESLGEWAPFRELRKLIPPV
jgi:15-cis-phytoene desaturase